MSTELIVITRGDFPERGLARLASWPTRTWPHRIAPDAKELLDLCDGATALLCSGGERIDGALLDRCPDVKVVALASAGYDNLDLEELRRRRIPASNTPSVLHRSVADLTMALVLAAARHTHEAERYLRDGRWVRSEWDLFVGMELHDATLGIVGYGEIGHEVAVRATAFGMNVVYTSRSDKPAAVGHRVDLGELLGISDVVSLHVPQRPDTLGLIGRPQLESMKRTAILVNTARGRVVDQAALDDALRSGIIAGAAIDVMEHEPIPVDDPLLSAPNLVLTPHYGSATRQARTAMLDRAIDNVLAGLGGERLPTCVNPDVYA